MKRIIGAVAVAMALLFTGACATSDEPQPTKTVFVQPTPEQEVEPDSNYSAVEDEFLFDVANFMTPALNDNSQAQVLEVGYAICESLSAGNSIDATLNAGSGGDISDKDLLVIAAAATVNLCPENRAAAGGGDVTTG